MLEVKPFKVHPRVADAYIMHDQRDGGIWIAERLKDVFLYDRVGETDRRFFKRGHVWIHDTKTMERELLNLIQTLDVLLFIGDDLVTQTGNMRPAEDLRKFVFNHPAHSPGFLERLWQSNIGKLCFSNGWFDFHEQEFHTWDSPGAPDTTMLIERPFPVLKFRAMKALAPSEAVDHEMAELHRCITNPIFNVGKQRPDAGDELATTFYRFLSRGLAGMVHDKHWGVGMGPRNCGKGVVMELCKAAFGPYCRTTNAENFILQTRATSSDAAAGNRWLMDFEFARLMYCNEIKVAPGATVTIDGNKIKLAASGGDELEGRRHCHNETTFKIQARLLLLNNDLPDITASNAKEEVVFFDFPSKFVEEAEVKQRNAKRRRTDMNTGVEDTVYRASDPHIKERCRSELVDAWTLCIMCQHWTPTKVTIPATMAPAVDDFKDADDDRERFEALFTFTRDRAITVSVAGVKSHKTSAGISAGVTVYSKWLKLAGCRKARGPTGAWAWEGLAKI